MSSTVLDFEQVHGDVVQCFSQFSLATLPSTIQSLSPLNVVVFAFWHYTNSESPLSFHHKVSDIRFFITKVCSICILRLQKFVVSTYWQYTIQQCLLFGTTKICSVCFSHYKTLQCSLFGITNFIVSSFFILKVGPVHFCI